MIKIASKKRLCDGYSLTKHRVRTGEVTAAINARSLNANHGAVRSTPLNLVDRFNPQIPSSFRTGATTDILVSVPDIPSS